MEERVDAPLLDKVEEAATALNVSRGTVWNLIKAGHLRSIKVMGSTRIPREDVLRLARNGTR
jgi:excisionase family DNA binding protein